MEWTATLDAALLHDIQGLCMAPSYFAKGRQPIQRAGQALVATSRWITSVASSMIAVLAVVDGRVNDVAHTTVRRRG